MKTRKRTNIFCLQAHILQRSKQVSNGLLKCSWNRFQLIICLQFASLNSSVAKLFVYKEIFDFNIDASLNEKKYELCY